MSWLIVAGKDFRDAVRSRTLWALTAVYVLFMAGFAYLYTLFRNAGPPPGAGGQDGAILEAADLVFFLLGPVALLIPLTALVIGYKSLAGEVESGSGKFLLSLPHTRRDAVVGKVVGRTGVLSLAILVGILVATVVIVALYDQLAVTTLVLFTGATLVLGAVYVSIAVGLSGLTNRTSRATVYAVGFFVVFEIIWDFVPNALYYLLEGSFFPPYVPGTGGVSAAPSWFHFVGMVSPTSAYTTLVQDFAGEATVSIAAAYPDGVPIYLTGWAAIVVLAAWAVVPVAVGYWRFREADL